MRARHSRGAGHVMLVDHHCHLDFADFAADRDAVIARARAAGVGILVTISTRIRRIGEVFAIADAHRNVFCSVGTHPHYSGEEPDIAVDEIVELALNPKVVAIGEAGLDYYYRNSSPTAQAEGFRKHIDAAQRTGLPLVVHTRDADGDTAGILEAAMHERRFAAILHCFTGGSELAQRGLKLGCYISFSGILTFKRSDGLREIAKAVPLDRLLVETDAPFLAPGRHRGRRNEPAYLVETAAELARLKGISPAELAHATTENFFRAYGKVPRAALAA
jgi:TatD DNase family protein